jgi:hypothetical protein
MFTSMLARSGRVHFRKKGAYIVMAKGGVAGDQAKSFAGEAGVKQDGTSCFRAHGIRWKPTKECFYGLHSDDDLANTSAYQGA